MHRRKSIIWIIIFSLTFFAVGLRGGICLDEDQQAQSNTNQEELFKSLEIFSGAISLIQTKYVEEVDSKELIYGALKGMLYSLDPYSQFLDPDAYSDMQVQTEGEFGGLGIEIAVKDNILTIISPIHGTPAERAGVMAGDRIIKIDGETTEAITLLEAVKKLRGKPKSEVTLTVFREKTSKIYDILIIRDIIKIDSIKDVQMVDEKIGYIRLVEFQENSPAEFKKAVVKLKKEGMDSLVLDVRNNPGGLLDSAIQITDMLLPADLVIVSTRGRDSKEEYTFSSKEKSLLSDKEPMVVLINEGSASGSEILAGALQDHNRAVLLGQKTFGKGSVQSVIPMSDGSAVRITTSKYYLPSGRSIHEKGIEPDIEVEEITMELSAEESSKLLFDKIEKEGKEDLSTEEAQEYDYQLKRAIDLIKGLKVYSKRNTEIEKQN
ncbi:MAG: S41 family peptidase [Candidatus Kappaea frigidicola]|nr:S41 family peptidase [Candidatus Kappaea frigidicola]